MITEYIIAIVSGLILDGVWLGVISTSLYQKYIGDLMLKQPRLIPALLFYIIYALAIVVFVTHPAIENKWGTLTVVLHAALLGLVIYGGYELTNLALLKGWSIAITYIDIAWGLVLTTAVSLITIYLANLFIK